MNRVSQKPAMAFNVHLSSDRYPVRQSISSRYKLTKHHGTLTAWYAARWFQQKPWGVEVFSETPRILLDRHLYRHQFPIARNLAYFSRWERVVNSMRVSEDRWQLVEEDGEMLKVNWKLYSERVNAEMKQVNESLPQLTLLMKGIPTSWRKLDVSCALINGLSVREAMAQCKFAYRKGHNVLFRALEKSLQAAEGKGLDKDKLRVTRTLVVPGSRDKQIDIKSKGYYAWRTKKSCMLVLSVTEDPELVLPDRSVIPYRSQLALRKAGIQTEPTTLDIPAITAEGI